MAKKEVGIGRLDSNERGGLTDMITPYSRRPLKNDMVPWEAPQSPKSRDPLGNLPKGLGPDSKD